MRKMYGFLFIAVLAAVLPVNCKNPSSPVDSQAPQISITIDPLEPEVPRGGTQQFTARVAGAAQTVRWAVAGQNSGDTYILIGGLLSVGSTETAETLTVTATSSVDSTKSASATVKVVNPGIIPKSVPVKKGGKQQFTAGSAQTVTWTVTGKNSSATVISNSGLLTVGSDETALTLTVIATVAGTEFRATVTVTDKDADKVWLVGIPDWTFPPGTPMKDEGNGVFTWEGDVAANATFRFSLTDTGTWTDKWNGNWYAPAVDGREAVIGNNDIAYYPTNTADGATEATSNAWKISAAGSYKITLNPGAMRMTLALAGVPGVTITGPNGVEPGSKSARYTAALAGGSGQNVTWTWSVTGGKPGTSIPNGALTVDGDERPGSQLTITAKASTGESGTKIVMVSKPGAAMLAKVPKPELSETGAASWVYEDDAKVTGYDVQLYKGESARGDPVRVIKGLSICDLRPYIQAAGAGSYTVTVKAVGDYISYVTSDESDKSGAKAFTQRTKVAHTWWWDDFAQWVNTDSAGDYIVQVYKNGTAGSEISVERKAEYDSPTTTKSEYAPDKAATGIGLYTFRVKAKGDGKLVFDSDWSAVSSGDAGVTGYSPFGNSRVWTITAGASGVFVAGGEGPEGGQIAYSNDGGQTWTLSASAGTAFKQGKWQAVRGIAYSPTLNLFVAAAYNGILATSDDGGVTWTPRTSGFSTDANGEGSIFSVAWGGNGTFVAGGAGGNIRQSADGITWTNNTTYYGSSTNRTILDGQNVVSIAYGDGKYIAGGSKAAINISTDGVDWTWVANLHGTPDDTTKGVKGIAFGGSTFVVALDSNPCVAVCPSGNVKTGNESATGWPGTWPRLTPAASPDMIVESVAFGGGKFIVVGGNGQISVSAANYGTTWTPMAVGEGTAQTQFNEREHINAAGFGNGKFILHGNRYPQWGDPPAANHNANMGKMAAITP